jgi:NAD(P)-dependent dehydrogenase (short-subunit alcohol dehydrogenase family)
MDRYGTEMPGPELDLAGAVAIVTGGGSQTEGVGNGRASAIMLARYGAHVAIVDRVAEAAEQTRRAIDETGGTAAVFVGDVSDEDDCREIVGAVTERLGTPTVLVNNVGVAGPPGTVENVDADAWDAGMRVNVKSMVLMSGLCVPGMTEAGGGAIVNMSSAAGLVGGHPAILYATSKGAITQLTRTMASQHGKQGIRVNCIAPGMVYTPMVIVRGMTAEMREARKGRSLLETEGTAWDVAAAVLFLVSPMARWITGVVLPVDGGYSSSGMAMPTPPRAVPH